MNVWKREIQSLNNEWKGASAERRAEIEEKVYHLEIDEREHYE